MVLEELERVDETEAYERASLVHPGYMARRMRIFAEAMANAAQEWEASLKSIYPVNGVPEEHAVALASMGVIREMMFEVAHSCDGVQEYQAKVQKDGETMGGQMHPLVRDYRRG